MSQIKKGDRVRQIVPAPIEGVVTEYHVCQESGTVSVTVQTAVDTDGDGRYDERVFRIDQVERIDG